MKKYILFVIISVAMLNCTSTKNEIKEYAGGLECYFKVTKKSEDNRFFIFNGYDKNNKYIEFKIGQSWNIYNSVEVGDTLSKKIGETNFKLIKRDTILNFPLMIRGKIVE